MIHTKIKLTKNYFLFVLDHLRKEPYKYRCHYREEGRAPAFNKREEEGRDLAAGTLITLSTTELPHTGAVSHCT